MLLVSYNIQYGKGRDGRIDLARIVDEIVDADVIALQEVERYWPRSGMQDQVALLAALLPNYYWVYGAGVDMHVEDSTPKDNRRMQFGNMLLCRKPILFSRHHMLPKRGSIDPLSIQRSAIEATVDLGACRVRVTSVHLTHLSSETRLPQVQTLLNIHQHAIHEGAPVSGNIEGRDMPPECADQDIPQHAIMMGDFNFQPNAVEYDTIVGPTSDYGGRISSPAGFVDAWSEAGNDRADGVTSDVQNIPATLDYCFVSSTLRDRIRDCRIDTGATGSDHLPLWTELDFG